MSNTNAITIHPSKLSSHATLVRSCVNEVCSFARIDDAGNMEDAIKRLRINVTRLETAARQLVKED